jgi:alpha/beta superfamily hydrolase
MARKLESLFLDGPAGRLEALLEEPEGDDRQPAEWPREAALVCHPHPQHGGTMHNKVVYRIARGLRRAGAVVLRFNYRGVNLSQGAYAHGEGELDDARAALAFLRDRYPGLPCTLAGFSFGSRIVLRLSGEDARANAGEQARENPRVRRVIAAGFPASDPSFNPSSNRDTTYLNAPVPRIFIQSTHDQFGPVAAIEAVVASLEEPKRLILIEARDHFFSGALDQLEEEIVRLS